MHSAQAGCESFNEAAVGFIARHDRYVLEETVGQVTDEMTVAIIVYGHAL